MHGARIGGARGVSQAPSEFSRPTTSFANARHHDHCGSFVLVNACLGLPLYIPRTNPGRISGGDGREESKGWASDACYRKPENDHEAISTNEFELGIFMLSRCSPCAPLHAQCD